MRTAATTFAIIVACTAIAYAARCSTGQQLYSAWQDAEEYVDICQNDVAYMWDQYQEASGNRAEAQYAVTLHMGFHGCSDPKKCNILKTLQANLASKIAMENCAREAWEQAQDELEVAKTDRDEAKEAWLIHQYSCQNGC